MGETQKDLKRELNKLRTAKAHTERKFTVLLSIIALLVLITATLAWFTLSNFASVNEIDLQLSTAPQLYLDIENRGTEDLTLWKKTLTNEMINTYLDSVDAPHLDEQLLDPVTTSDGLTFTGDPASGSPARTANENTFLEFKVWFVSTVDMWVHLSGQTVTIDDHEATSTVTTEETGAKADIIRSLRLSYEDSGSAPIWEPNKGDPVAGQTTFDVSESFSNDTRIFHLDKLTPKQITFRIWLEGEDPECDNDVQGAEMTIFMLFAGTDDNNVYFD